MLLSIMIGETLYVAHRWRRAILAAPVVLACVATARALSHHLPLPPHG